MVLFASTTPSRVPGTKQGRVGPTGLQNRRERQDAESEEGRDGERDTENRAGQEGVSTTRLVCLSILSLSQPLVYCSCSTNVYLAEPREEEERGPRVGEERRQKEEKPGVGGSGGRDIERERERGEEVSNQERGQAGPAQRRNWKRRAEAGNGSWSSLSPLMKMHISKRAGI